jgi:hypothetical protein
VLSPAPPPVPPPILTLDQREGWRTHPIYRPPWERKTKSVDFPSSFAAPAPATRSLPRVRIRQAFWIGPVTDALVSVGMHSLSTSRNYFIYLNQQDGLFPSVWGPGMGSAHFGDTPFPYPSWIPRLIVAEALP